MTETVRFRMLRFADDRAADFEHREDAERFPADLRDNFASFGLGLHRTRRG